MHVIAREYSRQNSKTQTNPLDKTQIRDDTAGQRPRLGLGEENMEYAVEFVLYAAGIYVYVRAWNAFWYRGEKE
jgi:hypothetical protein